MRGARGILLGAAALALGCEPRGRVCSAIALSQPSAVEIVRPDGFSCSDLDVEGMPYDGSNGLEAVDHAGACWVLAVAGVRITTPAGLLCYVTVDPTPEWNHCSEEACTQVTRVALPSCVAETLDGCGPNPESLSVH